MYEGMYVLCKSLVPPEIADVVRRLNVYQDYNDPRPADFGPESKARHQARALDRTALREYVQSLPFERFTPYGYSPQLPAGAAITSVCSLEL